MHEESELKIDIEELKHLETIAKRNNVKNVIKQEIRRLEESLTAIGTKQSLI